MKSLVVDASIAIKWFLPEIHAQAAAKILKTKQKLLAPDLIGPEVGNVLWKKIIRQEITVEESGNILKDFLRFPLKIYNSKNLLNTAWYLAVQYKISVYDSLYLSLAIHHDSLLVTADKKFYESLYGKNIGKKLVWVEDIK